MERTCSGIKQGGERCRQAPLRDEDFCFWHHPDNKEAAEQARKLGGQRRRREGTLQGAYDFEGLESVANIRRLLEIAVMDALGLDNSIPRVRAIISASLAAAKLLEVGELEDRVASLEAAVGDRVVTPGRRGAGAPEVNHEHRLSSDQAPTRTDGPRARRVGPAGAQRR